MAFLFYKILNNLLQERIKTMSLMSSPLDRMLIERIPGSEITEIKGKELEDWLPHRGMHLCLSGTKHSGGDDIIGYWYPGPEYFHFNLLPGHFMGESACLAGGILGQLLYSELRNCIPMMGGVHVIPVSPMEYVKDGNVVIHFVKIKSKDDRTLSFEFYSTNLAGAVLAKGEFSGTAVPVKIFPRVISRMAKAALPK
jgi:hypothetical protein